jgi:putative transposase
MCTYLLLAYIKFSNHINLSLQQILRLLHLNLFARRNLITLLKGDPPRAEHTIVQTELSFL